MFNYLFNPEISNKWELITTGDEVCYGTIVGSFPLTKSGNIKSIKLVHHSGSLSCNSNSYVGTYWGCSGYYEKDEILTLITDNQDNPIFPNVVPAGGTGYKLPGYDTDSMEIIINAPNNQTYYGKKGDIMKVYYVEDLISWHNKNNGGPHCINIFILYD